MNDETSPQGQAGAQETGGLCRNCYEPFEVGEPPILNIFCSMECHDAYVQQGFAEIKAIAETLYGYIFDDESDSIP